MKKILHISTSYYGSKVYKKLIEKLCENGFEISVYVPIRNILQEGKNQVAENLNVKYIYSFILRPYMKLFYFLKIRIVYNDICMNFNFENIDFIHTHFLFTDGGVAYLLKKKYNINYITTIRNADINLYFKYFRLARNFGYKIIQNSEALVFISPSYKENFLKNVVPKKYLNEFRSKSVVIPNGIDDFWHNNLGTRKTLNEYVINFLFVGELTKNKNIHKTIEILKRFKKQQPCNLVIIGSEGDYKKKIFNLISENSDFVKFQSKIDRKEILLEYYREADIFIMPSKTETFGLVYAEAMSQGLPCIYSKGQGIDGYFTEGHIGYSIDVNNVNDAIYNINKILENYSEISKNCLLESKLFNWGIIAKQFERLYKKSTKNQVLLNLVN